MDLQAQFGEMYTYAQERQRACILLLAQANLDPYIHEWEKECHDDLIFLSPDHIKKVIKKGLKLIERGQQCSWQPDNGWPYDDQAGKIPDLLFHDSVAEETIELRPTHSFKLKSRNTSVCASRPPKIWH